MCVCVFFTFAEFEEVEPRTLDDSDEEFEIIA